MINNVSDQQKHSAAHVLAIAVARIYGNVKLGVGPVTKDGFYYDMDVSQDIKKIDLKKVESEINNIIQENLKFLQIILPREEAINMLLQRGQIYKAELVKAIPDQEISFFKTGEEFVDLCRGPHVFSTNQIGIIVLTGIENTHWNEDPTRPKMIRIYGKVFNTIEELEDFNKIQNDLKTKNYKVLSTKLNLGLVQEDGHVAFSQHGSEIYSKVLRMLHSEFGHYQPQAIKLIQSYDNDLDLDSNINKMFLMSGFSYKDLPAVMNFEVILKSLSFSKFLTNINVYSFKFFLTNNELINELATQIERFIQPLREFDIDFTADVLTNDFDEVKAQTISNILQKHMVSHNKVITNSAKVIQFFIKAKDKYEKEWVLGFGKLEILPTNKVKENELIAIQYNYFPFEIWKFMIEKHEGLMPRFLTPVDMLCIPVNNKYVSYAEDVSRISSNYGFKCEVDNRSESLKNKIRRAEIKKVPILLIVGEKEAANNAVSVRENQIDSGLIGLTEFLENLRTSSGY